MMDTDKNFTTHPPIQGGEILGRRVKDEIGKKQRNLIRLLNRCNNNGTVPYQEFLSPNKLPSKISVDRLDQAPTLQEIGNIALHNAKIENKVFHGWVTIVARVIEKPGLTVEPSPDYESRPPNVHHADIVISDDEEEAKHARVDHAKSLAENAKWFPYPKMEQPPAD